MASEHHLYELAPDVMLQSAQGETFLVKLDAEDMFALNDTGAEILARLADGLTVDALVEELVRAYNAPADEVRRDVSALVSALVTRGLVRERTGR